jgi:hypothetical protein
MVRLASLASVREVRDGGARRFLELLVTDKAFNKRSTDEKREVMRTYGSLGKDSYEFLKAVITGQHKHLDEKTRAAAVYGIAMTNNDQASQFLRGILKRSEGPIRYAASEALVTFENQVIFGEDK